MRLDWIDCAKGIGILLVILGHTFCPESIRFWLYSFHMPLFFFLSGYVFNVKNPSFKNFLRDKIISLLIPAFIMECIIIIYSSIESLIFNTNYSLKFIQRFLGIFIQRRGGAFSFGPWFLICLFMVQILMFFLMKYFKTDIKLFAVGFVCSFLGYIYCRLIGIVLPWSIDVTFIAIFFFIVGFLIHKNSNSFEKIHRISYLPIYFFINIIMVYIQFNIESIKTDMYANIYGNYFLFLISSWSGILFIITLVKQFTLTKVLVYIGRNSLIYYALHIVILSTITLITERIISMNIIYKYQNILGVINVILCTIVLHFVSLIFTKYPFLLGKMKFFSKRKSFL